MHIHTSNGFAVHGYSLLRTQLNNDYFHDLFDESAKFEVPLEGHRQLMNTASDGLHPLIRNAQILRQVLVFTRRHSRTPPPDGWRTTPSCSNSPRRVWE